VSCDPRTSQALIDALFQAESMGLCLFGEDWRVTQLEGSATVWAPPAGASIDESVLFVGMLDALAELKTSGGAFLISGVSIGSDDSRALDVRVLWVADIGLFAAVSHSATERNQLQYEVSQVARDNRLLEQKIRAQQEKIAEQAALMRLFIRHTPAAVAMLDGNLELMMLSQRWIEAFGDPSLGDDPEVAGSPLRLPNIDAALRLAMDTGVTTSRVEKIPQRGVTRWMRWEQTPWRRADHSVGGTILFIEDVSDRMRATADLRAQSNELDRLNASVRLFGRGVAHNMREPLRRIESATKALAAAPLDGAHRERFAALEAGVADMNVMMDAMQRQLDLRETQLRTTAFDLAEAVEAAAGELREEILSSSARVVLGPTLSVVADRALVTRAVRGLIENALRYGGDAPTISISCQDEDGMVAISVADDGPGLPRHLHARAFEPFSRLDNARGVRGGGMGLAECRKIAELHGGTIAIDPDYDVGLRVLVNLPQNPSPKRA
jgi:signal transduction histidine kinase